MAQPTSEPANRATRLPQVALVSHYYYPYPGGGAERQAQRIAETLAAQGWRMSVLTRRLLGMQRRETINGVRVRRIWTSELHGPQSAFLALGLLLVLLPGPRGQVVHLNEMYRDIVPALLARRLRRCPIVIRVACGGAYGDVARLQVIPAGKLMLRLARRADAIISLSAQITSELVEHGFQRERIVEIPNGVDTHRFTPATASERLELRRALGLPQQGPLVIFVGRLQSQKGVETLLRAWKDVQPSHPSAHLLLVGQGPERAKLEKLAADLELDAAIHFLGQLEPVLPYLRASDVFVLPSFFEGLSNALLEAMACGLPVVTTNIGGTAEVIRPTVDGLLVEPGDAPALAASLRQVLGDTTLAQRLGAEARRRVEDDYTAERSLARYAALYARLSGSPRPLVTLDPQALTREEAPVE